MDRVTSGISCFSRAIQKRVFLFKILHDYENILYLLLNIFYSEDEFDFALCIKNFSLLTKNLFERRLLLLIFY